jgi:site-specific DNA recombinase
VNSKGNTALYLRLSREDGDQSGESQSIGNQRAFLLRYAAEHGMAVYDIYADDGFTGTNFDRPAFRRMIADIERGVIRTVLVKDLSRLGRDHIDTGYYFERYFPARRVRFIAVNDAIDTEADTAGNDMGLFRAAFNDLYAKDISKKVVSALQSKKKNGEFVGATPPYGYQKAVNAKNRLEIRPKQAAVVRQIYRWFLEGESYIGIARRLDANGIPPPASGRGWNDTTVKRILTNPTYMGNVTQNRTRKVNYKIKQRRTLPPREWITVPDTHEAIVSRRVFDEAQGIAARRSRHPSGAAHILSGLLFCGDCGARMDFIRRGNYSYVVCSRWKHSGGRECTSHCCSEPKLEAVLAAWLMEEMQKHALKLPPSWIQDRWKERPKELFRQILVGENKELKLFLTGGLESGRI